MADLVMELATALMRTGWVTEHRDWPRARKATALPRPCAPAVIRSEKRHFYFSYRARLLDAPLPEDAALGHHPVSLMEQRALLGAVQAGR